MTDRIGLVTLPATAAQAGELVGDPALTRLGDYLSTYINATLTTAWNAIAPARDVARNRDIYPRPVMAVRTWNPNEMTFNERDLPAMYLWAGAGTEEQVADDILLVRREVTVLWVYPPEKAERQQAREGFAAQLAAAVRQAVRLERVAGYVFPGDTDPLAPARGSLLGRALNAWSLRVAGDRSHRWTEELVDTEGRIYDALQIDLLLEEQVEEGVDTYDPLDVDGVEITARDAVGDVIVTGRARA